MREREPGHRAGHADRERGIARLARVGFAVGVEEDFARGRGRRGLAIVDGGVYAAVGEMDEHVAAAADIAGARIGHRQCKAGRHRGVDGVAAVLQDLDADARGARLLRHHHALTRGDRDERSAARGRELPLRGRLRAERSQPSQRGGKREQRPARHAGHARAPGFMVPSFMSKLHVQHSYPRLISKLVARDSAVQSRAVGRTRRRLAFARAKHPPPIIAIMLRHSRGEGSVRRPPSRRGLAWAANGL